MSFRPAPEYEVWKADVGLTLAERADAVAGDEYSETETGIGDGGRCDEASRRIGVNVVRAGGGCSCRGDFQGLKDWLAPVLRAMPDVQDFDYIVRCAISRDVQKGERKPTRGCRLVSLCVRLDLLKLESHREARHGKAKGASAQGKQRLGRGGRSCCLTFQWRARSSSRSP